MSARTRFRLYVGLSVVWALLLVQGIGHVVADGSGLSVPGTILWLAVQLALIALSIRARRGRTEAAD